MSELAVSHGHAEPNPLNIDLLTRTICKGASADELALFVQICKKTGLDPFSRQIFAVKRWDRKVGGEVMQPQVSIDGFRLIAQRSGEYAGQTPMQWCCQDGVWTDVWLKRVPPTAARVGILRRGFSEPLYAVAMWNEYCPLGKDGKPTGLWPMKPALMIGKCAESLGLRRAFPAELSDLHTPEEMEHDAEEVSQPTREERRADTERLLSATPAAAEPPPLKVAPVESGTLQLVAKGFTISTVKRQDGTKVFRVDVDGSDEPFAVTDPAIAHTLESESAFGHDIICRWEKNAQGKRVIREVLDA